MDGSPGASPRKARRSPVRSNGRVGVGVSVDTRPGGKVYKVRVYHKGKCLNLGRFSDLLKAQLSYDQAVWAMSCRGAKKVKTNFPVGTYPLDDADVQRKVQDFMASLAAASSTAEDVTAGAAAAASHQGGPAQLQLPNSASPSSSGADNDGDTAAAATADDADNWAVCSGAAGAAGSPLAATAAAATSDKSVFQQLLQLVPRDSLQHCSSELHRLLLQQQQQLGAAPAAAAACAEPQQEQVQPSFAGLLLEDELQLAGDFGPFHEAAGRSKSASCAAPPGRGGLALPACTGRFFSWSGPRNFGLPVQQDSSLPLAARADQQLSLLRQPSLVVQDAKKRRLGCQEEAPEGDASNDTHPQPKTEEQQPQEQVDDELELTLSNELLGLGLGLTHSMGSLMLTHSLELLMNGDPHAASQQQTPAAAPVEAAAPCATTDAPDAVHKATQGSAGSLGSGIESPPTSAPGSAFLAGPPRDAALQLIGETVRGLLEMNVALLRGTQTCALRDALMWLSSYRQKRTAGSSGTTGSSSPADRAALQLMGLVVQLLAQEASAADSGSSSGLAAFVERPTALSAVERLLVALTGLNELIRSAAGPSVGPALLHDWLSGLQDQAGCPADAVVAQVAAQLHQELMAV